MTAKQLNGFQAPDSSQYVTLTDGNGNLVTPGGGSSTITVGTTVISGGAAGQVVYDTGGTFGESTGITASNTVLSLSSAVTLTAPDTGTWTSAGITVKAAGSATTPAISLTNFETNTGLYVTAAGALGITVGGTVRVDWGITSAATLTVAGAITASGNVRVSGSAQFNWAGRGILTSPAANAIQLGAANSATPAAQVFSLPSVIAGTSNTAGVSLTITGSQSTGSGISGDLIFQTGGTGAAATAQNSLVTALTIKGATQQVQFAAPFKVTGDTTGAGTTAGFGTNSPATTLTAPYTWVKIISSDGSTVYCPAYK